MEKPVTVNRPYAGISLMLLAVLLFSASALVLVGAMCYAIAMGLPGHHTWPGCVLIIASGIYILRSEPEANGTTNPQN